MGKENLRELKVTFKKPPTRVGEDIANFYADIASSFVRVYVLEGSKQEGCYYLFMGEADLKASVNDPEQRNKLCVGKLRKTILSDEDDKLLSEIIKNGYLATSVGAGASPTEVVVKVSEAETKKAKTAFYSQKAKTVEEEIIKEGILSEEELDERIKLLTTIYDVKEGTNLYLAVLKLIQKQPDGENIEPPKTLYQPVSLKKETNLVKKMLIHLTAGNNLILEGIKSAGKNVAWETVAYLLNCRTVMLQCNGSMSKSEMFGHQGTDNSGKQAITEEAVKEALDGLTSKKMKITERLIKLVHSIFRSLSPTIEFVPGPITEALLHSAQGYGTILLLDEMNLSDPNTLSGAVNSLTDKHTKKVFVTGVGEVPISKTLLVGATQNSSEGDYVGTMQQNDATMSRFCCITVDAASTIYPILHDGDSEVSDEDLLLLDKLYKMFLTMVSSDEAPESVLNIRGFIASVKLIEMGYDILDAVRESVVNTIPSKETREVIIQAAEVVLVKDF